MACTCSSPKGGGREIAEKVALRSENGAGGVGKRRVATSVRSPGHGKAIDLLATAEGGKWGCGTRADRALLLTGGKVDILLGSPQSGSVRGAEGGGGGRGGGVYGGMDIWEGRGRQRGGVLRVEILHPCFKNR